MLQQRALAVRLRQPAGWCLQLRRAAPRHDIGKIGVPDGVLKGEVIPLSGRVDAVVDCVKRLGLGVDDLSDPESTGLGDLGRAIENGSRR